MLLRRPARQFWGWNMEPVRHRPVRIPCNEPANPTIGCTRTPEGQVPDPQCIMSSETGNNPSVLRSSLQNEHPTAGLKKLYLMGRVPNGSPPDDSGRFHDSNAAGKRVHDGSGTTGTRPWAPGLTRRRPTDGGRGPDTDRAGAIKAVFNTASGTAGQRRTAPSIVSRGDTKESRGRVQDPLKEAEPLRVGDKFAQGVDTGGHRPPFFDSYLRRPRALFALIWRHCPRFVISLFFPYLQEVLIVIFPWMISSPRRSKRASRRTI